MKKPTVGSLFIGAFPSDLIPKATKVIGVYYVIQSNNSCKLYKRNSVNYTSEFQ